ncbi:MAG: hypothetical protein JO312_13475 [Hyphomicrobiales bacterium]|nr:hypothetical protein [Hyphomicrobiales bacterium]
MATFTADAARRAARANGDAPAGALLAAGSAALFVGTLFYARLTPRLGLPASPAERAQALADALSLGSQRLWLAGGSAFLGDCLLLAACIVLASGRRRRGSGLEAAGWALTAVSAALAMIFDSMTAVLFWPLAENPDPGLFMAFKTWFDFLFAAGNVPFGLGLIAILSADLRACAPLLPRRVGQFGVLVGAAAAASGLASAIGLFLLPLAIGLTVTFGCVVLAALGVQIARTEPDFAAGAAI